MKSVLRRGRAAVPVILAVLLAELLSGCGDWGRRAEEERRPTYILVFEDAGRPAGAKGWLPPEVEALLEDVDAGSPRRVIVVYE